MSDAAVTRGPPEKLRGQLFTLLTQTPRPHRVFDVPRKMPGTSEPVGKVAMWPLTQSELMLCRSAAHEYTLGIIRTKPREGEPQSQAYAEIYRDACTIEVLCRACREADDLREPAFPSPKLVRETLTADECTILSRHYLQMQSEVGPIVDLMTVEEMDAWLTRLAEDGKRYPLALLASEQLEELLLHSASRLRNALTAITSSGSPPSDGSKKPAANEDGPPVVEQDAPPAIDGDEPPPVES